MAKDQSDAAKSLESADDWEDQSDVWYAKQECRLLLHRFRSLPPGERARLQGRFTQVLVGEPLEVDTPRGPIAFVLLGRNSGGRARSLLTKQPATIAWIDAFLPDSVFWDIGANIGVYTLYAGLRSDTRVVAFEPAAVNYFLLAANCELNGMDDRVDCLLAGLGDEKAVGHLEASQFATGYSFTFRGRGSEYRSRQAALLLSLDALIAEFGLACPNYIKLDVRALTEAILAGGAQTLHRPELRELHIEMKEDSPAGRRIVDTLGASGLTIASRHTHGGTTDITFAKTGG